QLNDVLDIGLCAGECRAELDELVATVLARPLIGVVARATVGLLENTTRLINRDETFRWGRIRANPGRQKRNGNKTSRGPEECTPGRTVHGRTSPVGVVSSSVTVRTRSRTPTSSCAPKAALRTRHDSPCCMCRPSK